jgi:hypothetical protein
MTRLRQGKSVLQMWSDYGRFDWLNRFDDLPLLIKSHVDSRDVPKKLTQHLYDFRFSRHFVLELAHIFKSVVFGKDGKGISFKNRLKGHIHWRKVLVSFCFGSCLASQNDSFTHGKVCTQMGSGQPNRCTTSDFPAVL